MFYKTINVLYPVASERNSESCGTTTEPQHSLGENCNVSARKRKASTKPESPRKRPKCASGPAQLAVEAVPAKSNKRKASTQIETPSKKQKRGHSYTDSDEPNRGTIWKEDRAEQLTSIRAQFEAQYLELDMLGEGGFGSVYAGIRKADNLPVAIKHICKEDVTCQAVVLDGKSCMVPLEALLMIGAGGGPASVGKSAAVTVLDWFDLEQEVLLVMERPVPCVDLLTYMEDNGPLEEDVAKNIMKQLVDAALTMHAKDVFHRDIKAENLLIETSTNPPRVRVIDFGCGCIVQEEPYSSFSGTEAYAPPEFFTHGRYEAAPTTVWQLGALLYNMLDTFQEFTTLTFLRGSICFNSEVSEDCKNFLDLCLAQNPKERATLEQIQLHPWLQNAAQISPQTPETQ